MSVWDDIEKLVQGGQGAQVTVQPGAEVEKNKRLPGRPRVRDLNNKFSHYATQPRTPYSRPRCMVCKKKLRKDDVEVCSDLCKDRAIQWLQAKLTRLTNQNVRVPLTRGAVDALKEVG